MTWSGHGKEHKITDYETADGSGVEFAYRLRLLLSAVCRLQTTNMALLDSIFSGEHGIAALLANSLAGHALIVCPGKQGAYNPETDTYEQSDETEFPVKFVQETMKRNVLTHVGGVQMEAGDLVGMIPAYQINIPLRRRVDHLRKNGVNYLIESMEKISSGDETVLVRILCKRGVT